MHFCMMDQIRKPPEVAAQALADGDTRGVYDADPCDVTARFVPGANGYEAETL